MTDTRPYFADTATVTDLGLSPVEAEPNPLLEDREQVRLFTLAPLTPHPYARATTWVSSGEPLLNTPQNVAHIRKMAREFSLIRPQKVTVGASLDALYVDGARFVPETGETP